MSDSKAENKGFAPNGASGRMLSRARRQAMSQSGKASLGQVRKAVPTIAPVRVQSVESSAPQSEPLKNDSHASSDCGCMHAVEQKTLDAVCALVEAEPPTTLGLTSSRVRQLCQERRRALSSQGKAAMKSAGMNAAATRHVSSNKTVGAVGLSGRAAARARREEMCVNGRGNDPACRPSGRVRSPAVPVKVEIGTTLSGNLVTGTQVERSSKVTGVESGSCRGITGTEYIGAEQYGKLCASVPPAPPAKVSVSNTSRNQRVSGVELGRSARVTGDEHGACKAVTGTEYLGAEQFESFCATKPVSTPAKVGVAITRAGLNVSGTEVGRSVKVTGDESGACNSKLTGSQYAQDLSVSMCQGSGVPHKVSVMSTVRDQPISGTMMEHNPKVTGDEYGGCQPISGTEYMGPDQYTAFCDADRQAASRALMASRGARAGIALSGTLVESGGRMTGAERGESQVLSGTPYSGPYQRVSQRGINSNPHPLTFGPANVSYEAESAPQAVTEQSSFSIVTPARKAQDSRLSRITGNISGAQGRITGPVNLAAGLVSGTPEFRYRDDAYGVALIAMEQPQVPEAQRSRLTGDGREGGFAITGAGWRRNESITGTEGTSATRRNPTLRGNQRSMAMQVPAIKDREHLQVPPSKVTGSSGNAATGSTITYSGGARG
ncbi:CsoS2 family carboxysome shell protein [Ferrovum myxofaciens]|uniref:CsoS2 family carboxysome shell protein n=1 Tax=Ferrovum myxofaciens TaxID=416213 RepID=UPI002353DB3C|nr:CsoS2 family carboxysome shell protein [Ferrovum myxofaciens]MBU6994842.1 transcriptional initiation protein Tat [Ferrovum myxofaciens]